MKLFSFKFKLIELDETDRRKRRVRPYIFRGIFMDMLKKIDTSLVNNMHVPNEIRPYSINIWYHRDDIDFILNIFNIDISREVMEYIFGLKEQKLNVGGTDFLIKNINIDKINIGTFLKDSSPVVKFRLRFITPTYFQKKGADITVRFPSPTSLFTNLTHLWNEFSSKDSRIDFTDFLNWVENNLYLTSYQLSTKTIDIGKPDRPVGFKGWCVYINQDPNNGFSNWLDTLCRFGQLSNLGGNRTAGCGVINYNPLEINKEEMKYNKKK
ncbi:MAG: CRISPR system precrRNA processing endoribonuclease RAMP protein Cas6 [Promethearchaeota archaeon]|nr:MAG: CRISPR system precrRNA processing endoribonuclease RAMP protein Cas6 [Candidatus Lokiarchaeota archaeon]